MTHDDPVLLLILLFLFNPTVVCLKNCLFVLHPEEQRVESALVENLTTLLL